MARYIVVLVLFAITYGQAFAFENSSELARLFSDRNINGTFVLYDTKQQQMIGHNLERAKVRFIPASTFKIANSLIGLDTGAVSNVDEVFYHHDGEPKFLKTWEQDTNLREAIKVSNVPAYQELARRVGLESMRRQVRALDYGNGEIGGSVDDFWLTGPLTISAEEQALFLARLAQGQLPCSAETQTVVRDICRLERGEDWILYGKTGMGSQSPIPVGWFVGWIERADGLYTFALNMDVKDSAELPLRVEIAKESLRMMKLLP